MSNMMDMILTMLEFWILGMFVGLMWAFGMFHADGSHESQGEGLWLKYGPVRPVTAAWHRHRDRRR